MARQAVAERSVPITLACEAFKISETCYRYQPKKDAEKNEDRGNNGENGRCKRHPLVDIKTRCRLKSGNGLIFADSGIDGREVA